MRYAICTTDPDTIADAREAGFDAVEVNVQTLIRPYDPDPVFEEALAPVLAAGLPIEAANVFLPKDLRCIGPDAVPDRIAEYAETVCRRLARAGASVLVFGSGGARQRPEGWSKGKADEQFVALLSRLGPIAERHGVRIAVEPLCRTSCNYINTVDEGAALASASGSPAVGVLADAYHWARNGETADTILAAKGILLHVHVATSSERLPPGMEPCDFGPFLRALAAIGYDGRLSVEATLPPPEGRVAAFRSALEILKSQP